MTHKKAREIIDKFIEAANYPGFITYSKEQPWILFIEGSFTPQELQELADLAKRIYEARDKE